MFYADEGFPVSDVIAGHWASLADKLAAEPSAAATYLPNGRAPLAGEIFRNPDLARSLRARPFGRYVAAALGSAASLSASDAQCPAMTSEISGKPSSA